MKRRSRRAVFVAALACLAAGTTLAVTEGYLRVKAAVASVLIDRALDRHLDDGDAHPPWPWADMHPVALLESDRLGVREPVLTGASGESMAFGVGHVTGTAGPGGPGNCVLAGHRDTSLAWLGRLRPGDRLTLRTHRNETAYCVTQTQIVDRHDLRPTAPTADARLTLVTCYPLDAILPGDERLVVTAETTTP